MENNQTEWKNILLKVKNSLEGFIADYTWQKTIH